MARLNEIAEKVRTKNAGPFWLTIDIFCGSETAFERVRNGLSSAEIADCFKAEESAVKTFEMPDLYVIKYSLPRPATQGTLEDRDMHGASWAVLVGLIEIRT
ncbi:DUF4387 family protein [Aestuariibius insulae]|uniref:DUF4387 family protein n=1 Tax=Aestuariibius insulae TaxID=2058287 RepID=UPI00345EF076